MGGESETLENNERQGIKRGSRIEEREREREREKERERERERERVGYMTDHRSLSAGGSPSVKF
jgi:hypothetical protein